jgi:SagB-type dehydrogenase family enzyme
VRSAAVLAVGGERDRDRLVAFVVPRAEERIAYLDLKLSQAGARHDLATRPAFELAAPELDGELLRRYRERRSTRDFHSAPVGGEALGRLLAALRPLPDDGSPLPKYRYPSAGSLYPVQAYVYVKPGRVEGLLAGGYYYHPRLHRLIQLSADLLAADVHGPRNRPIFERSAFSLFLVGQLTAIAPLYGQLAREFCLLEAGAISQLLMSVAPAEGLGLCPIGDLASGPLASLFALGPEHVLLHSLIGGGAATPEGPAKARGSTAEAGGDGAGPAGLVEELRSYLERQLPGYMVPAAIVLLGSLPLGASGKVDRRALRQAALRPGSSRAAHRAPSGPLEQRLAAIWSEVLEHQRVGADDHFLELGGDSIKAIQMLTRAREQGMELTVRELFEHPTIAGLAARLQAAPAPRAPAGGAAAARLPAGRPLVTAEELSQVLRESADE